MSKPTVGQVEAFKGAFTEAWEGVLASALKRPVSARAYNALVRIARDDVDDSIKHLEGSDVVVYEAWVSWYTYWARDILEQAYANRPWLKLDAETVQERKRYLDMEKKAHRRVRRLLERIAAVMPEGPMAFDDLALGVFGSRNNTSDNRALLSWLIGSQRHHAFGTCEGFDGRTYVTWRWKPHTDIMEWWKVRDTAQNGRFE